MSIYYRLLESDANTILEDIRLTGLISSADVVQAQNDLQYNYSKEQEREYDEIVPGTFTY